MRIRLVCLVTLMCAAGTASAQLYRWTDEKGRVHITDTPPPASAKGVQKKKPGEVAAIEAQRPFELEQAMKDFPVTLYTSPNCKEGCDAARTLLNQRAVPFKEVQVWEEKSNEELKRVSGGNDVPTLVVGRSVHRGFEPGAYQALLDSARYPRAGMLAPRAQRAPSPPEGYANEVPVRPNAEAVQPEPEAPRGPYAPRPPSAPRTR
jgi:glutaredoxin